MPRKTSQGGAKDTAASDSKNEGSAPRRSGRAVAKQETPGKDATRSRRSSTAAQTAASVADSRTPKGRTSTSSRRGSTSPSDSRTRTGSPGGRNKSSRRNASRINYKESDGEDETATPKYDENFESNEEVEDSEADEKMKSRGRSRSAKAPPKKASPKEKSESTSRSRRGRPSVKKDEEENETINVSEDSVEPEETPAKRGRTAKAPPKESPKPVRSRRQKSEPAETKSKPAAEEKPKRSRRSSRASSGKEETPKKRPSRSVQARRYTEEEDEEDEEVEEITEDKPNEEEESKKEVGSARKRKRASTPEEPNKRLKETEEEEEEKDEEVEEKVEAKEEEQPVEEEKKTDEKPVEEPMDVDESDSVDVPEDSKDEKEAVVMKETEEVAKEEEKEEKTEPVAPKVEDMSEQPQEKNDEDRKEEENVKEKEKQKEESLSPIKSKQNELKKSESVDGSEKDESMHSSDSEQASRPKQSLSSGLDDSQEAKDIIKEPTKPSTTPPKVVQPPPKVLQTPPKVLQTPPKVVQTPPKVVQTPPKVVQTPPKVEISPEKPKEVPPPQSIETPRPVEAKPEESKSLPPPVVFETNSEKVADTNEHGLDLQSKKETETVKNDSSVSEESKTPSLDKVPTIPSTGSSIPVTPVTITQSKEPTSDASFNGAEKNVVPNSAHETHSSANMNVESAEQSIPKANGAHNDVQHTNSTSPSKEQYYSLPGRRYVINSKLSESLRQSLKNQTFGFVSYNLGTSGPDAYIQKDKFFNELNKLDAHLICLQQVAKPFYTTVLEPSLDALGFKSIFTQPEDSLKGMATFYKSSLFRLCEQSTVSLKQLVEKELEASSLDANDRSAVKTHVRKCGSVLFCHFSTVIESKTITVANVQIPPTDLSINALQVSCLAREVVRINGGTSKPLLIGGEFNIAENDASYQLLKDGYLSNEMIEELQRRKDIALPEKENASLVNLLWKSFQHPSSNLCSCYTSVLGHEFVIPELKSASPDLVWYSSDSLHTVGVLDAVSDKPGDRHFSLKADIAFAV